MTTVLLIMLGGTVGFFTAALCKAAGRADRDIELLEAQENNIDNYVVHDSEVHGDLAAESIEMEKESLI